MRVYGELRLNVDSARRSQWVIRAEPHVLLRIRRILPKVQQVAGDIWIRDTPETCSDLRWICDRWPLRMTAADLAHLSTRADADAERVASFPGVLEGSVLSRPLATALPLRSYQAAAVELTVRSGGLLVGDELGTGKTAIGIGLMSLPDARPAVVVTLTALPEQWKREIERFLPGTRVHIARKGTAYDVLARRGGTSGAFRTPTTDAERDQFPDVFILSYSKLAGWADSLAGITQTVVFDEAHELRNAGASAKYRSAEALCAHTRYRLGLTGTPVFNYGDDIWSILQVLQPDGLGSRDEFLREWCSTYNDRIKDPAVFGSYLRSAGLYIRRTRQDVGRELPPLTVVPVPVDADPSALHAVKSVAADLARQILTRTSVEKGDVFRASGELDWRLRQATGIAKAPSVAAFVQLLIEQGEQVLLCGWHRAVYDLWANAFDEANIPYAMYTGEENPKDKAASVQRFVAGEAKVLIMSLRAGAGLDGLQASNCGVVVFGELDWSPAMHKQCIGRLHRDGQLKTILAYYLLCEYGSDPVITDVLGVKRQQALGVEDPTGTEVAPTSDPARSKTLAESYLRSIGEAMPEVVPDEIV